GVRYRTAAHPDHPPRQADGIDARSRHSRQLEEEFAKIPKGDAGGVPPSAEGIEGQRRRRAEDCSRGVEQQRIQNRHFEPTGRANASPMINSAKQSTDLMRLLVDCVVASLLAMTRWI